MATQYDKYFTNLGSGRYLDTRSGEEISRRQYYVRTGRPSFEAIRAERQAEAGYRNPMARYNAMVRDYRTQAASTFGIKPTDIRVRGSSPSAEKFKTIVRALKSKDNSPTGAKADALILLGRREPEWSFAVGETPGGGR